MTKYIHSFLKLWYRNFCGDIILPATVSFDGSSCFPGTLILLCSRFSCRLSPVFFHSFGTLIFENLRCHQSSACVCVHAQLHQAPPSMGFSRQECWNGLPCPTLRDLPNPRIKPWSPVLQADSLPLSYQRSPIYKLLNIILDISRYLSVYSKWKSWCTHYQISPRFTSTHNISHFKWWQLHFSCLR